MSTDIIMIIIESLKGLGGLTVGFLTVLTLSYWQLWRGRFWGRVTFSMVSLRNKNSKYQLVMNTILDEPASNIWINNKALLAKIRKAAEQAAEELPYLRLEGDLRMTDEEVQYHVMSGIRQQVSEQFKTGILKQAIGRNMAEHKFVYSICAVKAGSGKDGKARKLRVFVILPELLERIFHEKEKFLYENIDKQDTVIILYKIAQKYMLERKEAVEGQKVVWNVRIYYEK